MAGGGCPRDASFGLRATTDFLSWEERDAIRRQVFAAGPPICTWCHEPLGDHRSGRYYHVDHVTPRSHGGGYRPDNLVLACKTCNSDRGSDGVLAYMARRATKADRARASQSVLRIQPTVQEPPSENRQLPAVVGEGDASLVLKG